MVRRTIDVNNLKFISLFQSLTGAKVKDCIVDEDHLLFIIEKGDMGLAIGKGGKNLKRAEKALKKPVKVLEYSEDIEEFIKNYSYPVKDFTVEKDGRKAIVKGKDTKTKGKLIGRDRTKLKKMTVIVKRFFDVNEIEVK